MAYALIKPRRGKATEWTKENPILAEGEIAVEAPENGVGTGLSRIKIGDGVTAWNDLPYAVVLPEDNIVQSIESEAMDKTLSVAMLKNLLEKKLDKKTQLDNVSVNDVYETGIYKSNSWLDSPFSVDKQGTLIVFNYTGNTLNGWYTQMFISPHYEEIKIRKHDSTNYGSWFNIINSYTAKDLEVSKANTAETANKAINDGNGNNIVASLEKKLDKVIMLTDTSVDDIYQTGIYRSDSWKDDPNGLDGQGVLICINYAGTKNGWFWQIFLFPYSHTFRMRGCLGGSYSEWREIIDSANNKAPTGKGIEFQIVNGELQYRYDTEVWS